MKIIVLSGSPRNGGNTDLLVESFVKGASSRHDVEVVTVREKRIHPCTGCNGCFLRQDHRCVQQDDMQELYDKLAKCDVLAAASPVYFYGVSAQLKAVIDRLHTPLRETFSIQKLALLLVGASTLPAVFDSIKVQYQLILDYFHLENAGMVVASGVKEKGDILNHPALEEGFRLGATI